MPILNIEGRRVTVDDSFLRLSPEEQNRTVDEIASSLGIGASEPAANGETFGGVGMNATAGVNEGLYGVLGAPVDLVAGAMNLGIRGFNAATGSEVGTIDEPFGGSRSIGRAMGAVAPQLDPENTIADTAGERIARGVGQGVGYAVAPEAAVGAMARGGQLAGRAADTAGRVFGRAESVGAAAGNAAVGGVSGAGSQAAMEVAPDELDPIAGMVGGLAAGGVAVGAAAVPGVARAGARVADDFTAPMRADGRERLAAERLQTAATDPQAVRDALDEGVPVLVPGSEPTTFQATGDMGLGAMERAAETRDPAAFNQRRSDQNAARVDALGGVQPDGAPEAVANALRQRLQQIDDETQSAIDAVAGQAEAKRSGVDETTSADLAGATRAAQDKAGAMGAGMTPDAAGDTMRGAIEAARAKAKAQERALWSAVDPDGTLALGTQNVREQARAARQETPKSAKPPSGEEAAILDVVAGYKETMPFSEMTALQSRLKAEMRTERFANGESPAYRRLSMLNSAVQNDLETAVAGKVAKEADAVARGEMEVSETAVARLQREQQEWYEQRAQGQAMGQSTGTGARADAALGPRGISPAPGAQVSGSGGFRDAPGAGRVSEAGVQPNFDAESLGRLNEARAVTKGRVETFDNKTLAPIRRRPGTTSPYEMPSGAVPNQIFKSGAKGFDAVETYRRAVGNDPEAMNAIRDFAVDRLRRVAGRPDGTLDPSKVTTWRRMHSDALRAFPDLDAQLQSAAGASEAVAAAERNRTVALRDAARTTEGEVQAARSRTQALAEAKSGTVGRLAGVEDPQDVVRLVGGVFSAQDSAQRMLKLRGAIGRDEAARQGLRKAVVEHMTSKFVGNTEAATSGVGTMKSDGFQTFVRQNNAALRTAGFGEEEIALMERIAADLQQANRSIAAVKLPGRSNTTQDTMAVQKGDRPSTILAKAVLGLAAGGGTGFAVGGPVGAAVGAGVAPVLTRMRQAGLDTVEEIVTDALLNPERAKILLSRPTGKAEAASLAHLGRLYRESAVVSGAVSLTGGADDAEKPDAAAPGVVPVPEDRERAKSPRLTPEDRASPIPSDLIDDGKAIMDGGPIKAPAQVKAQGKEADAGRGPRVAAPEARERWGPFPKRSGTLGIPRSEMPQIAAEHRGALTNFLAARGIKHSEVTVPADSLKPTQREFSRAKVEQAKAFKGGNRAILVSSDWQILDGHHQWLAKREAGEEVRVIRLDAPIGELMEIVKEFPSATMDKPKSKLKALQERARAKADEKRSQAA